MVYAPELEPSSDEDEALAGPPPSGRRRPPSASPRSARRRAQLRLLSPSFEAHAAVRERLSRSARRSPGCRCRSRCRATRT